MRSIELFSGAGGLGIGLHEAGFHPVSVIERDRYCCDTIRENQSRKVESVKGWKLFPGDVRECDFRSYAGKIKLISGGPPCQPFSLGGKHGADSDARDMFPEAIRAVRQVQPLAFVFENVRGLTRAAFRNYFEYIRLQLEHPEVVPKKGEKDWIDHLAQLQRYHTSGNRQGLHYRVVTQVLNAADYGVPQKRERVFFVGFREDLGIEWHFPEATHSQAALLWDQKRGDYWDRHKIARRNRPDLSHLLSIEQRLESHYSLPWQTVRDAISDLPDPQRFPNRAGEHHNHVRRQDH